MNPTTGFKEWQIVCDALSNGSQCVILRKGGIHEGRQGFSFAHDSFFLFPTRFHAQADHVREGQIQTLTEWQIGDTVPITHRAQAIHAVTLTDWDMVAALTPFHILTEATVRERFEWQGKGMNSGSIHAALVRVFKLAKPWELDYTAAFGGCRSWVKLPPAPESDETPVIGPQKFAEITKVFENLAQLTA